jgi:pimeloyl-ACP methyl ester carboxylesterase
MAWTPRLIAGPEGPLEFFERPGEPGGGALLLIHGIQGAASIWNCVLPHLPPSLRILGANLRGRGRSLIPPEPQAYEIEAFAADLEAVIAEASREPGPLMLAAWSMGVLVTLACFKKRGALPFNRMVFVGGTACCGDALWFKGKTVPELAAEAAARAIDMKMVESAEPHAVAGAWLSAQRADYSSVLPCLAMPVLIMHGADDATCPLGHGRALAEAIPGAKLSVWENGPHNLMAVDPVRFAGEVMDFLR